VEVVVSDRVGLIDTTNATISVVDVQEIPVITTANGTSCSVPENSVANTPCSLSTGGIQLLATDEDENDSAGNLTFVLDTAALDGAMGFFYLDETSSAALGRHGAIRLTALGASTANHEVAGMNSSSLMIRARDPGGLLSEPIRINIIITDVQELPAIQPGQHFYVRENTARNSRVNG